MQAGPHSASQELRASSRRLRQESRESGGRKEQRRNRRDASKSSWKAELRDAFIFVQKKNS